MPNTTLTPFEQLRQVCVPLLQQVLQPVADPDDEWKQSCHALTSVVQTLEPVHLQQCCSYVAYPLLQGLQHYSSGIQIDCLQLLTQLVQRCGRFELEMAAWLQLFTAVMLHVFPRESVERERDEDVFSAGLQTAHQLWTSLCRQHEWAQAWVAG